MAVASRALGAGDVQPLERGRATLLRAGQAVVERRGAGCLADVAARPAALAAGQAPGWGLAVVLDQGSVFGGARQVDGLAARCAAVAIGQVAGCASTASGSATARCSACAAAGRSAGATGRPSARATGGTSARATGGTASRAARAHPATGALWVRAARAAAAPGQNEQDRQERSRHDPTLDHGEQQRNPMLEERRSRSSWSDWSQRPPRVRQESF